MIISKLKEGGIEYNSLYTGGIPTHNGEEADSFDVGEGYSVGTLVSVGSVPDSISDPARIYRCKKGYEWSGAAYPYPQDDEETWVFVGYNDFSKVTDGFVDTTVSAEEFVFRRDASGTDRCGVFNVIADAVVFQHGVHIAGVNRERTYTKETGWTGSGNDYTLTYGTYTGRKLYVTVSDWPSTEYLLRYTLTNYGKSGSGTVRVYAYDGADYYYSESITGSGDKSGDIVLGQDPIVSVGVIADGSVGCSLQNLGLYAVSEPLEVSPIIRHVYFRYPDVSEFSFINLTFTDCTVGMIVAGKDYTIDRVQQEPRSIEVGGYGDTVVTDDYMEYQSESVQLRSTIKIVVPVEDVDGINDYLWGVVNRPAMYDVNEAGEALRQQSVYGYLKSFSWAPRNRSSFRDLTATINGYL